MNIRILNNGPIVCESPSRYRGRRLENILVCIVQRRLCERIRLYWKRLCRSQTSSDAYYAVEPVANKYLSRHVINGCSTGNILTWKPGLIISSEHFQFRQHAPAIASYNSISAGWTIIFNLGPALTLYLASQLIGGYTVLKCNNGKSGEILGARHTPERTSLRFLWHSQHATKWAWVRSDVTL